MCSFSFPISKGFPFNFKFSDKKRGDLFPGPKGSNCFNILKNFGVISLKLILVSICNSCSKTLLSVVLETIFSNLVLNFSRLSFLIVNPAAYLCPPNWSICSLQPSRIEYRSTPLIDLAEAVKYPLEDSQKTIEGL